MALLERHVSTTVDNWTADGVDNNGDGILQGRQKAELNCPPPIVLDGQDVLPEVVAVKNKDDEITAAMVHLTQKLQLYQLMRRDGASDEVHSITSGLCCTGADTRIVSDTVRVRGYENFEKSRIQDISKSKRLHLVPLMKKVPR